VTEVQNRGEEGVSDVSTISVLPQSQNTSERTGWAKKTGPDNFCNNFVYC